MRTIVYTPRVIAFGAEVTLIQKNENDGDAGNLPPSSKSLTPI